MSHLSHFARHSGAVALLIALPPYARIVKVAIEVRNKEHLFEKVLSVACENIEFEFSGQVAWSEFWLNPRRLRGSDFLMRWSQGAWSEERIIQAVNETRKFFALPYGPSGAAPDNDVRAFEVYFERLEKAGLGKVKRPDLLIFRKADESNVQLLVKEIGGVTELPFTPEEDSRMSGLLSRALLAIECENSLWRARQMPDFDTPLTPQKRLGGKLGLKKTAVLPTVILKEEDRAPLRDWLKKRRVPIHIWHVFYDMAFGLPFDRAEQLIKSGQIEGTEQTFQAPGGATTKKTIYKIYYRHAYALGESNQEPKLAATHITDKNGHILPYVKFEGGSLRLSPDALSVLTNAASQR